LPVGNSFGQSGVGSSWCPSFATKIGTHGHGLQFEVDAMVERIISELSDRTYETTLAVCGACCFVSLLLAATI
jgi:hypothetical protein